MRKWSEKGKGGENGDTRRFSLKAHQISTHKLGEKREG